MNVQQQNTLQTELESGAYDVALATRDFNAVALALNARASVPNPEEQPQTPVQFTWNTFLALLSPAEILGLYGYGFLCVDLRAALEENDRAELASLWRAIKSVMPQATVTAVETAFAATEPDPNWQSTISLPSRAMDIGLPFVTAQDVETVWQRIAGE